MNKRVLIIICFMLTIMAFADEPIELNYNIYALKHMQDTGLCARDFDVKKTESGDIDITDNVKKETFHFIRVGNNTINLKRTSDEIYAEDEGKIREQLPPSVMSHIDQLARVQIHDLSIMPEGAYVKKVEGQNFLRVFIPVYFKLGIRNFTPHCQHGIIAMLELRVQDGFYFGHEFQFQGTKALFQTGLDWLGFGNDKLKVLFEKLDAPFAYIYLMDTSKDESTKDDPDDRISTADRILEILDSSEDFWKIIEDAQGISTSGIK